MIHSPYTLLASLAYQQNEGLLDIFTDDVVLRQTNLPCDHNRFSHFLVQEEKTDSEEKVRAHITHAMQIIRDANNDLYRGCKNLQEILTDLGLIKLLNLMSNYPADDEEIIRQVIAPFKAGSSIEQIQALFKGMPLFRIEVEDSCPNADIVYGRGLDNAKESEGRYRIRLVDCISNSPTEICFETKAAKVIFLWFLLNTRHEKSKDEIIKNKDNISQLFDMCYPPFAKESKTNTIETKEDFFDNRWNTAKSGANRYINNALGNRDLEEWYIIYYDKKNKLYSLSLPQDYIILPDSLKRLQQSWI